MSIEEFGLLFADLLPDLRAKWPNCPPTAGPDEFGTLRFKLFLTLFCLRRYQPYQSMEVTFGWSASAIGVWCDTILAIMDEKYASFRAFPDAKEQENICWRFQEDCKKRDRNKRLAYGEDITGRLLGGDRFRRRHLHSWTV